MAGSIPEIVVIFGEEDNLSPSSHISTDPSLELRASGDEGSSGVSSTMSYDIESDRDLLHGYAYVVEAGGSSSGARGVLIIRQGVADGVPSSSGEAVEISDTESDPPREMVPSPFLASRRP
ncbi:unnamed protein product [Linum trigynum]|uniref:Uncharacterized protein n=1 Tax=Linum trigynum TaxID=586398 RepID=A0AAV2GCV3_9ROSI